MNKLIIKMRLKMSLLFAKAAVELKREDGMATVEYAILIVAASGFAGLLAVLLKSDWVKQMLTDMIAGALES